MSLKRKTVAWSTFRGGETRIQKEGKGDVDKVQGESKDNLFTIWQGRNVLEKKKNVIGSKEAF